LPVLAQLLLRAPVLLWLLQRVLLWLCRQCRRRRMLRL
jgi:hypothetical protein